MDRLLMKNAWSARYLIGGIAGFNFFYWKALVQQRTLIEMFGIDGNGGRDLKIITDLSDEEMARLKHVRRSHWHWRGQK